MSVIRTSIKYLLLCPLVIAFFIALPAEAADSVNESKEEVEETKLYFKVTQSVRQKPKHRAEPQKPLHYPLAETGVSLNGISVQRPRYILYCNLIFYE